MPSAPVILRARVVAPITRPPIDDGAVVIWNQQVKTVGRWRDVSAIWNGESLDLGEAALLPGLVNAHCHLDYTDMVGQISPQRSFSAWIKCILGLKLQWDLARYEQSWVRGADLLVRTGTTTVGDIEAVPSLLPAVWRTTPLRVISFLEMTGLRGLRTPTAILRETMGRAASLPHGDQYRAALSPHAPYSTTGELLRLSAAAAIENDRRLSIHVAESDEEFEMFTKAAGPMFEWLQRNERDMSDCGLGSPVQHLERNGSLVAGLVAAHVNYLAEGDADLLARRGASVVHCPRSHAYFGHRPFPHNQLSAAGVNLCLGTDSLATVIETPGTRTRLSMFAEMRAFATAAPSLSPRTVLEMATTNAARALGWQGAVGEIRAGAWADLVTLPFSGRLAELEPTVVDHDGEVTGSMIGGVWAIKPAHLKPACHD